MEKSTKLKKVLVTVSIGVLKSNMIAFNPELGPKKKEAIESISFEPGFKVIMKFYEKFYPDAIELKVKNGEKVFYDISRRVLKLIYWDSYAKGRKLKNTIR